MPDSKNNGSIKSKSNKADEPTMFQKGSVEASGMIVSEKAETVIKEGPRDSKREEPLAKHDVKEEEPIEVDQEVLAITQRSTAYKQLRVQDDLDCEATADGSH